MKIKVEYIILILIITALSAFLLLKNNNRTNYNLPQLPRIEEKDISKIILHKADEEILLAKENDEWLINKDKFSADKEKMNAIIKEITATTIIALMYTFGIVLLGSLISPARYETPSNPARYVLTINNVPITKANVVKGLSDGNRGR